MKNWEDYSEECQGYYDRLGYIFGELDDLVNKLLETNRGILETIKSMNVEDDPAREYFDFVANDMIRESEEVNQRVSSSAYSIDVGRWHLTKLIGLFNTAKLFKNS